MLKRIKLSVQLNAMSVTHIDVPAWEVPILRAMHGDAKIKILGEATANREPPNAEAEFERLQKRYGQMETEDGGKGQHYVAAVYGQFGVGTAALARAIEAAIIEVVDTVDTDDLIGDIKVSSVGG